MMEIFEILVHVDTIASYNCLVLLLENTQCTVGLTECKENSYLIYLKKNEIKGVVCFWLSVVGRAELLLAHEEINK